MTHDTRMRDMDLAITLVANMPLQQVARVRNIFNTYPTEPYYSITSLMTRILRAQPVGVAMENKIHDNVNRALDANHRKIVGLLVDTVMAIYLRNLVGTEIEPDEYYLIVYPIAFTLNYRPRYGTDALLL
jgi:hypothetical protein